MNAIVDLQNVTVDLDDKNTVNDVSFQVFPGEILVLVGESGGGKTTILRTINGLVKPTSGSVLINGTKLTKDNLQSIHRQMGYVLQQISLFPNMTIEQNLHLIPDVKKLPRNQVDITINNLMKAAHLPISYLKKYPKELSGGEQQRVGIIRAFASQSELILMDEPFSALDPVAREQLQDLTLQIHHTYQSTIIFVTHDMNEALKIGQKIAVIKQGQIEQIDTPENIVQKPINDYVSNLFHNSEAKNIENIYVGRLPLENYGQNSPYKNLVIKYLEGDTSLGSTFDLLSKNYQLAIKSEEITTYLSSQDILRFMSKKFHQKNSR